MNANQLRTSNINEVLCPIKDDIAEQSKHTKNEGEEIRFKIEPQIESIARSDIHPSIYYQFLLLFYLSFPTDFFTIFQHLSHIAQNGFCSTILKQIRNRHDPLMYYQFPKRILMNSTYQFDLKLSKTGNMFRSQQDQSATVARKYPLTERAYRYIPKEFRDKHIPAQRAAETDRKSQTKPKISVAHNPFKKREQKDLITFSQQPMYINGKNWNVKKENVKPQKKCIFLNQSHSQMPKLRQTKSTQCHSPKAVHSMSRIDDFHKIRQLGRGKFGVVYLVKHIKTGFVAALKVIDKLDLLGSGSQNEKRMNQLLSQIKIQRFLNHPNLIKLYDFFSDDKNVYLLLQLACDGHLYDFLVKKHSFNEETTSIIAREIIEGVDHMHKHNIIHRDIKLQNIVLSHGMAKICDFGWSVYCPKEFRSTLCGTPIYLSPEVLVGKSYNKKIDTWAIGALTHELFTSENPFKIKQQRDLYKIITDDFEMQKGSPELRSFITFILRKNPAKRPDTETIKRHPFIDKFKDLQTSEQLCRMVYGR